MRQITGLAAMIGVLASPAAAQAPLPSREEIAAIGSPAELAALRSTNLEAVPGEFLRDTTRPQPSLEQFGFGPVQAEGAAPGLGFEIVREVRPNAIAESAGAAAGLIPNYLSFPLVLPRDPQADDLWMIDAIGAREAWSVVSDASEIVVAVIDDGVFLDHEDLRDNIWTNPGEVPGDRIDNDGNGYVDDVFGYDFADGDNDPNPSLRCGEDRPGRPAGISQHGTHVAGTLGAVGGNETGVIGVAPRIKIMALKVQRSNLCGGFPSSTWLEAARYAADNGAKIINLSLGGPAPWARAERILAEIGGRGVLIVAAAGNEGMDNDAAEPSGAAWIVNTRFGASDLVLRFGPGYPATYAVRELISVGSAAPGGAFVETLWGDHYNIRVGGLSYRRNAQGLIGLDLDAIAYLPAERPLPIGSNYGARSVHIAAPGKNIVSTVPLRDERGRMVSGYASMSGTSMAAPAVAGAAALVWTAFPEMTAREVKTRLMATATRLPAFEGRTASGHLDLLAALCAPGAPRPLPGCPEGAAEREAPAGAPASLPLVRGASPSGPRTTPLAIQRGAPQGRREPEPEPEPEAETPSGPINLNDLF